MKTKNIPTEIYEQVEAELLAGEQLLWVGQPDPLAAMSRDRLNAKISAVVGLGVAALLGILLLTTRRVLPLGVGGWPSMMGIIFLLIMVIGVAAVVGPLLLNYLRGARTLYAITDRRALIIAGKSVQSYREQDIEFIERKMRGQDKGDIIFKRETHTGAAYYGGSMYSQRAYSVPIGFFGIDNVREVEALMLETFRPESYRSNDKPKRGRLEAEELYYEEEPGAEHSADHSAR